MFMEKWMRPQLTSAGCSQPNPSAKTPLFTCVGAGQLDEPEPATHSLPTVYAAVTEHVWSRVLHEPLNDRQDGNLGMYGGSYIRNNVLLCQVRSLNTTVRSMSQPQGGMKQNDQTCGQNALKGRSSRPG
jgi:hypothetical protein